MPQPTVERIKNLFEAHEKQAQELKMLWGRLKMKDKPILNLKFKEWANSTERIPLSLENYITTQHAAYLAGNAPTLLVNTSNIEGEYQENLVKLIDNFRYQTSYSSVLYQLIYGAIGARYSWMHLIPDEKNTLDLKARKSWEVFEDFRDGVKVGQCYVYKQKPEIGSETDKEFYILFYYDKDFVYEFRQENSSDEKSGIQFKFVDEKVNLLQDFPFVKFTYNLLELAQFEFATKLIDAADLEITAEVNERMEFALAYLLSEKELDASTVKQVKDSGAFSGEGATLMKFLTRDLPTEFSAYLTEKQWNLIHILTATVDLLRVSGGESGVARRFLLQLQQNAASQGEMLIQESLKIVWNIITDFWKRLSIIEVNPMLIETHFSANLPEDLVEEAQIQSILQGKISDTTRFKLASFIDDPEKELELMTKEKEMMMPENPQVEVIQDAVPNQN